jgi:hypothetical protein
MKRIAFPSFQRGGHPEFRRMKAKFPKAFAIEADAPTGLDRYRAMRVKALLESGLLYLPLEVEAQPASEGVHMKGLGVEQILRQCAEFPHGRRNEWVAAMMAALD